MLTDRKTEDGKINTHRALVPTGADRQKDRGWQNKHSQSVSSYWCWQTERQDRGQNKHSQSVSSYWCWQTRKTEDGKINTHRALVPTDADRQKDRGWQNKHSQSVSSYWCWQTERQTGGKINTHRALVPTDADRQKDRGWQNKHSQSVSSYWCWQTERQTGGKIRDEGKSPLRISHHCTTRVGSLFTSHPVVLLTDERDRRTALFNTDRQAILGLLQTGVCQFYLFFNFLKSVVVLV